MSRLVGELERRGEDLSELKLGMLGYLRRIAAGQMLPEIAARYFGQPLLLSRASSMPLPDQERLVADQSVEVYEVDEDGQTSARRIPAHLLSAGQIRQVIGRNGIRGEQEQLLYARENRHKIRTEDGVVLDVRRRGIRVGQTFIPAKDLAGYLARLSE